MEYGFLGDRNLAFVLVSIFSFFLISSCAFALDIRVAAYNSSSADKAAASYICDGVDDQTEIQNAVNSVSSSGGGIVYLASGTFRCGSEILMKSNVELRGAGKDSTIIDFYGSGSVKINTGSYITVSDFQIRGKGRVFISTSHVTVNNIKVYDVDNSYIAAFYIYGESEVIEDIKFINCEAIDVDRSGFDTYCGGSGCTVKNVYYEGCRAVNCGRYDHYVGNSELNESWDMGFVILDAGILDNVTMKNCHAEGCWEAGFHSEPEGLGLAFPSNIRLINCSSKNNGWRYRTGDPLADFYSGYTIVKGMRLENCTSQDNVRGFFCNDKGGELIGCKDIGSDEGFVFLLITEGLNITSCSAENSVIPVYAWTGNSKNVKIRNMNIYSSILRSGAGVQINSVVANPSEIYVYDSTITGYQYGIKNDASSKGLVNVQNVCVYGATTNYIGCNVVSGCTPGSTTTTIKTTTTTIKTTTTTIASDLAIHLKFDEGSGLTAYDSSPNANNGLLVNGTAWTTGKSGSAAYFDGTNDYIDCGSSSSLDIRGPITIAAWVKPYSAQELCSPDPERNGGVAGKVDGSTGTTNCSWQLRFGAPNNCYLGFTFNSAGTSKWVTAGQTLAPGTWYHVAATYDGSTITMYVNGYPTETNSMSSLTGYTNKLILGSEGWGNCFHGAIDDFRIYNRALSASEIASFSNLSSCSGTITSSPVITPTAPMANQDFQISCAATFSTMDCVRAYADGSSNQCAWSHWSGNTAVFNCTGMAAGTYTATCKTVIGTNSSCCLSNTTMDYIITGYGADVNPTGNPIGGGAGYNDIILPTDPNVICVVSSKDQFINCLSSAGPGEIVYIDPSATIDLTGIYYGVTIPGGVCIASNRGYNGSLGGRIIQGRDGGEPGSGRQCALKTGGTDIRITGLRVEGPDKGIFYETWYKSGIVQNHLNLIVDNCEIFGWSHSGILMESSVFTTEQKQTYGGYFHHNYIHHCMYWGMGYGVTNGGTSLIEANKFDYARHFTTDSGDPNHHYEARYNIFGPNTYNYSAQADVHPVGGNHDPQPVLGTSHYIHHNTFYLPTSLTNDNHIRVSASYNTSYIDHNIFYRESPAYYCIYIYYGKENIIVEDNYYAGGSKYAADNSTIVRYVYPDFIPWSGRPVQPRVMLPPMTWKYSNHTTTTTVISSTTTIISTTTTTKTTTTTIKTTTTTILSDLAIHLKFDEGSGLTAYDSSPNANNGLLVNGTTWTTGKSGSAAYFDGTNDYIDCGSSSSLDIRGPITIAAWVKPYSAQELCAPDPERNGGVAGKVDGAAGSTTWSWQFRFGSPNNCYLGFQFNDAGTSKWVTAGQTLVPGTWYHVAATYDGSTITMYVNGYPTETNSMSSLTGYANRLILGAEGWGMHFHGAMDDFRIYRKSLSASEISFLVATNTTTTTKTTTTIVKTTTTTIKTTTTMPGAIIYPIGSCEGRCGKISLTGTCYCDAACAKWGDCCPDACYVCGYNCPLGGTIPTTTIKTKFFTPLSPCFGYCGQKSPAGCYCDKSCVQFGDCCWDICSTCGYCAGTTTTTTLTTTTVSSTTTTIISTTTTKTTTTVKTTTTIPSTCYGAELCNPTGSPIGGGAGYTNIVTGSPQGKVATDIFTLKSLIASASSGDTIFIPATATINLTGNPLTINKAITIASDRGYGSSQGALLTWHAGESATYNDTSVFPIDITARGVRITGMRIKGPNTFTGVCNGNGLSTIGMTYGLRVQTDKVEIDNCEILGFGYGAIAVHHDNTYTPPAGYIPLANPDIVYIHHNYIHHNCRQGFGYGVVHRRSESKIEANIFDENRHHTAGYGDQDLDNYEAAYNIFKSCAEPAVDQHCDQMAQTRPTPVYSDGSPYSGGKLYIHHNDFYEDNAEHSTSIGIRGVPKYGAVLEYNWFKRTASETVYIRQFLCPANSTLSYPSGRPLINLVVSNNAQGLSTPVPDDPPVFVSYILLNGNDYVKCMDTAYNTPSCS